MTVDVLDRSGAQLARVYQATGVRPSFRSLSDPVQVPEGGIIRITATYKNDTDATILPGPKWDGQEAFRLIAFHSGKPQPAEIAHWVFQR